MVFQMLECFNPGFLEWLATGVRAIGLKNQMIERNREAV